MLDGSWPRRARAGPAPLATSHDPRALSHELWTIKRSPITHQAFIKHQASSKKHQASSTKHQASSIDHLCFSKAKRYVFATAFSVFVDQIIFVLIESCRNLHGSFLYKIAMCKQPSSCKHIGYTRKLPICLQIPPFRYCVMHAE